MFNLNTPPVTLLGSEGSALCSTPKTPEIVNSLIAMTNPLDAFNFTSNPSVLNTIPVHCNLKSTNTLIISQDSNHSTSSVSPLESPVGLKSTPSVQQTCSQLIKAGLKLSIQSKRKFSSCESSSGNEQCGSKYRRTEEDCDETTDEEVESKILAKGLTPEDEDRRRRRRERNKIAATKCRMKKRERTNNLIKESEQLDNQNIDLKIQVRALEIERRNLVDMLQSHKKNCVHDKGLNLELKFPQSASKYLTDLNLEETKTQVAQNEIRLDQDIKNNRNIIRTSIPPMSTIKFTQNNEFSDVAVTVAVSNTSNLTPEYMLPNTILSLETLNNGYCKASPPSQEIEYFQRSTQEGNNSLLSPNTEKEHSTHMVSHVGVSNCETSNIIDLEQNTAHISSEASSLLMSDIDCPVTMMHTTADFVKNELVESQSPYTTAQSAERFLFENNCENFIDIKHACTIQENNMVNNTHTLEFHSNLPASFNDNLSLKNDFLQEAELLAQLTADGSEFVDLDSSVTSAFLSNGGCLA